MSDITTGRETYWGKRFRPRKCSRCDVRLEVGDVVVSLGRGKWRHRYCSAPASGRPRRRLP